MKDIEKKIDEVLTRGVGEFIDPDGSFRQKLIDKASGKSSKEIIIKYGVDPTRPDIHLGHAVCLRKLRQFQDLGCKVIFLVGDFTAQIGDPTGKSKARLELDQQEIEDNIATYQEQIGSVLSLDPTKFDWMRNSDWILSPEDLMLSNDVQVEYEDRESHNKFLFSSNSMPAKAAVWEDTRMQKNRLHKNEIHSVSILRLLSVLRRVTHARLIERDMFKNRLESGEPLFMHEMLYPVFQGIDSNVMAKIYGSCDLEVGGTDQTFNMLMGREMMSAENIQPQSVLAFKLLVGLDGKEKMSKSLDNYIAVNESPNSMFGKVMSLPDTSIMNYFELCTNLPLEEIAKMAEDMVTGGNPRDAKVRLAKEIVRLYHGDAEADKAEQYFIDTFSKGHVPEEVREVAPQHEPALDGFENVESFIARIGLATSKSDARRKIEQGGVTLGEEKIVVGSRMFTKEDNGKVMKVGKKDFVKIVF